MAWIYLAGSVDSLLPCRPGCDRSPTVKGIDTAKAFWLRAFKMGAYQRGRSGTMCALSTFATSFVDQSILSTADFPARTLALRDLERVWKASARRYSLKSYDSSKKFAQLSSSLKMSQQSGHADLHAYSLSSPLFGMTVDGRLSLPLKLEPRTLGKGGSCLPTPCAKEGGYNKGGGSGRVGKIRPTLSMMATRNLWPTPRASPNENRQTKPSPSPSQKDGRHGKSLAAQVGGQLNPTWVEWLMGYPSAWTVLEDWATQWFRSRPAPPSKR